MPLFVWLMAFVAASEPTIDAFPEGVRFDLATGRAIEVGAPLPKDPIRLVALGDEVVSFQLRIAGDARALKIATSTLAPGVVPELFVEHGIDVREASESEVVRSLGPARYPDALLPAASVDAPAMLFVDIFVPRATKPGVYNGAITIGSSSVPLALEVLAFALPERDVARLGAVSFASFLEREGKDRALLRRWMQLAHAHHLSVELMKPTPAYDASTSTIDWEPYFDRYAQYLDGSAFSAKHGYRGPRADLPVTRFVAPLSEWWPGGARDDNLLPKDPARWSRALNEWEREVEKRGFFERKEHTEHVLFINALDEAKTPEKMEAIKAYGPLIDAAAMHDRKRILFRVDGVLGARAKDWPDTRKLEELGTVVDVWNMHGAVDTAPIKLLAPRLAQGERAMFYASNSSGEPAIPPLVVDSAIAGARAWAWIVARYRLEGAINWEFDFAAGCVENPKCSEGGTMNLDALLAYRSEELGGEGLGLAPDTPIPSMRLKALRRGAQDVAILSLLKPDDASRIAERMIPRALGEATGKKGSWPKDQAEWEYARAEMIALLKGEPPPPPPKRPLPLIELAAGAGALLIVLIAAALIRRSRARS